MRWSRTTRIDVLLSIAAVLLVSGPLLFTHSGFAYDFTNSLWMAWAAGKLLAQAGHPELFVNTTTLGVFYPLFAFYGGPLYMTTGAISELLGGRGVLAFTLVTLLAIAGVYGGILWLARELGLRGLAAHAPALTALTSAYYTTDLYGRGDWSEFMTISAIAPLLASGLHLLRAPRWRPLPVAIFAVSSALFTGGHNITLLWGATIIAAAAVVLWLAGGAPRQLPYRRAALVAGLGLASALIDAWSLLPDIAYAGKVAIAHGAPPSLWGETREFNLPAVLLDPLRRVPRQSTTPGLYDQAPDWLIAWSLLAAALLLGRRAVAGGLRRLWIGGIVVLGLLLAMIMLEPFWTLVGYPYNEIQFPYRLSAYVFYAAAGIVLAGALALQRVAAAGGSRRLLGGLRLALAAAVAVSLALCVWQLWVPNTLFPQSYADRAVALRSVNLTPATWYGTEDYSDRQAPQVPVYDDRVLFIEPAAVHGDRFAAWMAAPPGPAPIQTNISGGTYLVHLRGLRVLGRNPAGLMVVQRLHGGNGPVYVVLETTPSALVELGRALSLLALLLVLAAILGVAVRACRR
jgi:hypothetical protein